MNETRPGWWRLALTLLVGGAIVSFPHPPVSYVLRLWALGWLLEMMERRAATGSAQTNLAYPSWRHPWVHFKRGTSFFLEAFPLLFWGSFLLYVGWLAGWIISFERVRDYMALGPVTTIAGFVLLAPCLVLLPMATVRAALAPGTRASWDIATAREIAFALPVRYFILLVVTMIVSTPLQILRQPQLQKTSELFYAGVATFSALFALKLAWARHYKRAAEAIQAGRAAGPKIRRPMIAFFFVLGLFYGLRLVLTQFMMWGSHTEWFAHFLFLLPGAPASADTVGIYW